MDGRCLTEALGTLTLHAMSVIDDFKHVIRIIIRMTHRDGKCFSLLSRAVAPSSVWMMYEMASHSDGAG